MKRAVYSILFIISVAFITSCGQINGQGPAQFAGIVDEIQFDTLACQPAEKTIKYQNQSDQAQSIKWISYQRGTNLDNYFRIKKIVIGGTQEFIAVGNEIKESQNAVIPPKGVLEVYAVYKPRKTTNPRKGEAHVSYLDIFLGTPALGDIQYKMTGRAPELAPGCGDRGPLNSFKVKQIKVTIKDKDIVPAPPPDSNTTVSAGQIVSIIPGNSIDTPFQFYVDNSGKAVIDGSENPPGIPVFKIPAPGFKVDVNLIPEEYEGTFDGKDLNFDNNVDFIAAFKINVSGVKVTTGSASDSAPDGDISLTGAAFDQSTPKVVFAAKIPEDRDLKELNGGVIGVEIELQK